MTKDNIGLTYACTPPGREMGSDLLKTMPPSVADTDVTQLMKLYVLNGIVLGTDERIVVELIELSGSHDARRTSPPIHLLRVGNETPIPWVV